ncbi:MAG: cation:dicarboxylase symporter family transporter [Erysipelotrichia bacterium]|nr:cation:dicarboxylase symporter family transporter [Erysipelotrichia bacterium]NCC54108.1 cation:dicarboxylase symporter family transporter [Erysipelotrichia bacterium]
MENAFLNQFLMISDFRTVLFLGIFFLLVLILYKIPKQRLNFSKKVLLATLLGLLLGFLIQWTTGFVDEPMKLSFVEETTLWYSLIGNGFIDFIRMLVIPLVMISIIHVIIHMDQKENLSKLVKRGILTTMVMVMLAAIVGLAFGIIFHLGGEGNILLQTNDGMKEIVPVVTTLRNLIPANPIAAMVNNNIVGLVIFASFIALAARRMHTKHKAKIQVFYDLIDASQKIVVSIAMSIIKFMPYAVLALLANTIAQRGLSSIMEVAKFIVVLYLACIVQLLVQLFALSLFKVNPFFYLKKSVSILLLAFTSRSSLGVLPATIDTLVEDLGVSQGTASFVASFGTTAGMQGCAGIFPALLIIYVANLTGTTIDLSLLVMSVIVITIGSIGIAGIPGTSTMAASVGLSGVGLGPSFGFVTPILAIDPIIDMMRTMLNVSGSLTNAIMVDRQLQLMDMKQYYQEKKTQKLMKQSS